MQGAGWLPPDHGLRPALPRALASCLGHKDRSVLLWVLLLPDLQRTRQTKDIRRTSSWPPDSELDVHGTMLVTPDAQGQQGAVLLGGLFNAGGQRRTVCAPSQRTSTLKPTFPMLVPPPISPLSPFSNKDALGRKRQKAAEAAVIPRGARPAWEAEARGTHLRFTSCPFQGGRPQAAPAWGETLERQQ